MTNSIDAPSAYTLLHLRDGAPRDLVDETYWLLVRRLKYGVIEDVEGLRQLDRLNAAYESIVRNGVRRDTASNGHNSNGKPRRRWSRRKNEPLVLDPYETLFVTPEADPDIALLAAKVLAGRPPADIDGREWNEAVMEAAATLSARWQQAQETSAVEDTVAPALEESPEDAHDHADHDVARSDATPVAVEQAETPARDEHPAPPVTGRSQQDPMDVLAASVMPAADEPDGAAAPVASFAVAAVDHGQPTKEHTPVGEVSQQATPGALTGPRGWIERLRGRSEERAALVESENDRLLSLRGGDDGIVSVNGHHADAATQRAELRPEPRGPMTLELAPEDGCDFLLGNPDEPAHIQIWWQAGRYLLQQLSGPAVAVGGAELVSPIVVLEDGDEVACGGDVVRIAFVSRPAAEAADVETAGV